MTEREALKLALEALETLDRVVLGTQRAEDAITAIKEALAQPEPVAWPCVIAEADFSENTITLTMQCTDYKVSAGKHWLSTNPPQRTWVRLDNDDLVWIYSNSDTMGQAIENTEAKLKEKNT